MLSSVILFMAVDVLVFLFNNWLLIEYNVMYYTIFRIKDKNMGFGTIQRVENSIHTIQYKFFIFDSCGGVLENYQSHH